MCQFFRQLCGHHRKAPRSSDRSSDSSTNITQKKDIILDNFRKSWAIAFIVFLDSKTKLVSYLKKFQITIWFAHSFWIWKTYFSIAKPHIIFGQEWYKPKIYQKRMNNRDMFLYLPSVYLHQNLKQAHKYPETLNPDLEWVDLDLKNSQETQLLNCSLVFRILSVFLLYFNFVNRVLLLSITRNALSKWRIWIQQR